MQKHYDHWQRKEVAQKTINENVGGAGEEVQRESGLVRQWASESETEWRGITSLRARELQQGFKNSRRQTNRTSRRSEAFTFICTWTLGTSSSRATGSKLVLSECCWRTKELLLETLLVPSSLWALGWYQQLFGYLRHWRLERKFCQTLLGNFAGGKTSSSEPLDQFQIISGPGSGAGLCFEQYGCGSESRLPAASED